MNHRVHLFCRGCLTLKLSLSWKTVTGVPSALVSPPSDLSPPVGEMGMVDKSTCLSMLPASVETSAMMTVFPNGSVCVYPGKCGYLVEARWRAVVVLDQGTELRVRLFALVDFWGKRSRSTTTFLLVAIELLRGFDGLAREGRPRLYVLLLQASNSHRR